MDSHGNLDSDLPAPTDQERVEQIRARANATAKDFDKSDVLCLLDRIVEVEKERDWLRGCQLGLIEQAKRTARDHFIAMQQRLSDVRELIEAVERLLVPFGDEGAERDKVNEALEKVRRWCNAK